MYNLFEIWNTILTSN